MDAMIDRRRFAKAGLAVLAGAPFVRPALAQTQTTRIVVGFSAGGAVDVVARATGDALRKVLAHNVIVENRSGAGGKIAVAAVANAEDDGRTLLFTPSSILTLRPHVEPTKAGSTEPQVVPVSPVCEYPFALTVGPGTPARTLGEFVTWCRANPGQASFGSPGPATAPHVIGALFGHEAKIPLVHVPYRGGAQAINDLLGGQLPAMVTTLPAAIPLHRSGKLRILASTASRRSPLLADVPTFVEAGFAGMHFEEWFGFFAPARLPAPAIEALNVAVRTAVGEEATRKVLDQAQFSPRSAGVAEFASMMQADTQRWRSLVARLDIQPS